MSRVCRRRPQRYGNHHCTRLTSVLLVAGMTTVALGASATPASAATLAAAWYMNEPQGATVMQDSSANNHDGKIGSKVRTGVAVSTTKGYRFNGGDGSTADTSRLVLVDDAASLNPGSRNMHIEVQIRTTSGADANLLQKGQAGTWGGMYKVELNAGKPACYFTGDVRQRIVTWGSKVNDGAVHTIKCDKLSDRIRISVDGKPPVTAWNGVGSIRNYKKVAIGGKHECNPGAGVDCDYYTGDIGYARITFD